MELLNDLRPWWGWLDPSSALLAAQLVQQGTLSAEVTARAWWAIERGASLIVAAGPRGAGKSTLANALLEFLPETARVYVTSGPRDPLNIGADRERTYLLVNELSWHLPFYLGGPAAARAFELLGEGVRMVGTLHATSVAETVEAIMYEAGISPEVLAAGLRRNPMLVLVLDARRSATGVVRRVSEIGLVRATADAIEVQPVTCESLAAWVGHSPETVRSELVDRRNQLASQTATEV